MRNLLCLITVTLCLGSLGAQVKLADVEKSQPPIKLATKVDAKGMKEWDAFPHQNCPVCKGKKVEKCQHCEQIDSPKKCPECNLKSQAPCHACAGKGSFEDPLEWAPCPGCMGHSLFPCFMCGNRGEIHFEGGGKSGQKCSSCKGAAAMMCSVCNRKRLVKSGFAGKMGKTPLKKLQAAKEDLGKLLRETESFRPTGNIREDRKKFLGMFKDAKSDFPVLKSYASFVENVLKGVDMPNLKDIEKRQEAAFRVLQHYLLYYLVHQIRTLDACIEREEWNEKAGKKAG